MITENETNNTQQSQRHIYSTSENTLARIIEQIYPNTAVLDIGCALMLRTNQLTELKHCIVDGVITNQDQTKSVHDFYNQVWNIDFEKNIPKEIIGHSRYDYIICSEELWDPHEPRRLLQQLAKYLTQEGKIIVSLSQTNESTAIVEFLLNDASKELPKSSSNELSRENEYLRSELDKLQNELKDIKVSHSWKLTKPLRISIQLIKSQPKIIQLMFSPKENGKMYRHELLRKVYHLIPLNEKIKRKLKNTVISLPPRPIIEDYAEWIMRYDTLSENDRAAIHEHIASFPRQPLISIIMPTYNTPEKLLLKTIASVSNQLYQNWELCIADDASTMPHVCRILNEYAQSDPRIKVVCLEKNSHISTASNSALKLANGEYIALLDHDDELSEHALYWIANEIINHPEAALIYSDEDKIDEAGQRTSPYFKPDWNPDLLLSQNYVSHLGVYKKDIVDQIGGFRVGFEGSQDWDMLLRFTKKLESKRIRHIPNILYHWRTVAGSTAVSLDAKPYVVSAARQALIDFCADNLSQVTFGEACHGAFHLPHFKPQYNPLVSIIIPTRNGYDDLKTCIESLSKTTYKNYEILIIDNESSEKETLNYLQKLTQNSNYQVLSYPHPFNYAAMHNWAVPHASGEFICLLNNDTEIITPEWLEEMLGQAQRPGIGAVGARLLYPDNTLQHAGVVTGLGGIASHAHKYLPNNECGYFGRAAIVQNFSAVTGACLLVRKHFWIELGGMSAELPVAFNDVDFCLRLNEAGLRNVWLPQAVLYHHESKSRGNDISPEKIHRFTIEHAYMQWRWNYRLTCDPAYNPNLTLASENFGLAWPPRVTKPWNPSPLAVSLPFGLPGSPTEPISVTINHPLEGEFLIPHGLENTLLVGILLMIEKQSKSFDGVLCIKLFTDQGQEVVANQTIGDLSDNTLLTFSFRKDAISLTGINLLYFQITLHGQDQSVAILAHPLNKRWGHQIAGYEHFALRADLLINKE
ncbi:glycosyltransferase family 2 protein [Acidithiobacillus thiooxidans]|uniref:Glycosyltransferase 2-like domain-containing protein n=1 Tax=Acidithiobacillus thiooxidans TaxID=930 RepID=A0A1C2JFM9_ACITH|nr:glycosyltransferase family 2 protein [Acidithiobacillus thiooxidans]OCX74199.1 hypothetical protein A6M23_06410 [Acidithiobacillus thiooxidans]OCX87047.1 hypothetical protein A6P08_04325 [Acidithiobacillus thiooxidans]